MMNQKSKKKLSTAPLVIDLPERSTPDETKTANLVETKEDLKNPDSTQQVSVFTANEKQVVSLNESSSPESSFPESSFPESSLPESSLPESSLPESSFPESSFLAKKYTRVSMRLSEQAAQKLKALRMETGIPYEVLVDVLVCNWDKLSQKNKSNYLKLAQKERSIRLVAGQHKAMKTIQNKYLNLKE